MKECSTQSREWVQGQCPCRSPETAPLVERNAMARGVKRLLKILLVLILLGAIAYVSIVLMVCWKETHVAAPG